MKTREYRMGVRADQVAATRDRLLGAVIEIGLRDLDLDPRLETIAARAGVTVQTALRHFGSRSALLRAAADQMRGAVREQRPIAPLDVALRALVEHYDELGDFVLVMLGRERSDAAVAEMTESGKRLHREWVEAVFAARLPDRDRDLVLDLLVVATDVYAWKLLRRDRGLAAEDVQRRFRVMTDAVLAHYQEEG